MDIKYRSDTIPETGELIELFENSEYFPIKDKSDTERIKQMFLNANIVITAWDRNVLVGISRSLCDFEYCCYLSDICVRDSHKGKGIGKKMVELTKEIAGDKCKLILHSSPDAKPFYDKIGMEKTDSAFIIQRAF